MDSINGIINVLKPPGMTSFDVVGFLRRILKTKKIGHTGTLDPGAIGVLPICVGNATKAVEYLTEKDKLYRAEILLGESTDTQDSYGKILLKRTVSATNEDIINCIKSFEGKQNQIPPMYSAVRIDGKKLYELARSGITVERKSREIQIYSIKVININNNKILMDVSCSKGTYIRTLCNDIGERLGCGGHMSFLLRQKSGDFDLSTALTLEEIYDYYNDCSLCEKVIKIDAAFNKYRGIKLVYEDEIRFNNGLAISFHCTEAENNEMFRIYDSSDNFIALGAVNLLNGKLLLKSVKFFNR